VLLLTVTDMLQPLTTCRMGQLQELHKTKIGQ